MSDTIDSAESSPGVDTDPGNWLVRNLWLVKGLVVAVALVGLGYASLAFVGHEMGNVLWGMAVTLAAFVLVIELGVGAFRAASSA